MVRENIADYFTLQLSFNGTEHTFSINFWGAIMKKIKIKLDDMERRILVKLLYEKRNELIREGRYTDAIDELILKIIDAKGC